ncbi:MAG: hypothetical protein JSW08_00085 [archaeon]|nr:MAG: hypothetical protein JSW08_00085 [archaeon]
MKKRQKNSLIEAYRRKILVGAMIMFIFFLGFVLAGTISVTLDSPQINYTTNSSSNTLQCGSTTDALYFVNSSLYTNYSGTWEINQTNIATPQPAGEYRLEGTSGVVVDNIGYSNLTNSGATRGTSGIIGNSFNFSTGDDLSYNQTAFNYSDISTQPVTLIVWFNPSSLSGEKVLAWKGKTNGQAIFELMQKDDKLRARSNRNSGTTEVLCTTTISTGSWYMGIIISNSTGIYCGTNGVIENSTTNSNPIDPYVEANFSIGAGSYGATTWGNFTGALDEISVFNVSLNSSQLLELYNSGNAARPTTNTLNSTFLFPFPIISTWNCEFCDIEGDCESATSNRTEPYVLENSRTYNTTTYETSYENFIINVTANSSLTDVNLIYNGTSYDTSKSGSIYSTTLSVPNVNTQTNVTFYWNFTYAGQYFSSNSNNQTIEPIEFGLCNATLDVPFWNITFKDESDSSDINATINSATFEYYFGNNTLNKTLSFTNTTANDYYTFCFSVNRTIYIDAHIPYASTGYPQRIFNPPTTAFTNSTTNTTLYLISTAEGIYVTFQVINTADQPLEGVLTNITRNIGGTETLVSSGETGADGAITYWLDPDNVYTANFYLSPYDLYSVTQLFTQTTYTITLGGTTTSTIYDYHRGVDYSITPINSYLSNGTSYNFNFTISSSYWALEEYGFNITNENRTLYGNTLGTTSNGSTLSLTLNTGTNETFIMNYYWTINSTNTTSVRSWKIIDLSDDSFSLAHLGEDFDSYVDSGLFGLTDFGTGLILFFIIIAVVGVTKVKWGISNTSFGIGLIFALVALFDVSLGILPNPINAVDHFPTIIMGILFIGAMAREGLR